MRNVNTFCKNSQKNTILCHKSPEFKGFCLFFNQFYPGGSQGDVIFGK